MPKVSIVMPVYNTEKYVGSAIESILSQTFGDFEFVIIDDGSTDGSWRVIQEYAMQDARIKAHQNQDNKRLVYTRNIALDLTDPSSEYIGICDADDSVTSHWLEKTVQYMQDNSNISAVGIDLQYMDAKDNLGKEFYYPKTPQQKKLLCFRRSPLAHGGALIRIADWKKIGFWYDESYLRAHDYELWSRFIGQGYHIAGLDDLLVRTYHRVFGGEQGKRKYLTLTLKNSVRIQWKMIREYNMIPRIGDALYIIAECILYLLPGSVTFRLFKQLRGIG